MWGIYNGIYNHLDIGEGEDTILASGHRGEGIGEGEDTILASGHRGDIGETCEDISTPRLGNLAKTPSPADTGGTLGKARIQSSPADTGDGVVANIITPDEPDCVSIVQKQIAERYTLRNTVQI